MDELVFSSSFEKKLLSFRMMIIVSRAVIREKIYGN